MSNFEWIDDYLTNRLNEQDRQSFEQQLESDPALRSQLEHQRLVIEGIKKARAVELKTMLKNITVPSPPLIYFSPMKVAAGIIGAAALTAGLYFYYNADSKTDPKKIQTSIRDSISQQPSIDSVQQPQPVEDKTPDTPGNEPEVKVQKTDPHSSSPKTSINKPALDIVDPSKEITHDQTAEVKVTPKVNVVHSKIEVIIDSQQKKYANHYQFLEGKLLLYGNFDSSLYEVLEINGDKRSVFLYFQSRYYHLDEAKTEITQLREIKDARLIQKLNLYRSK